MGKIVPKKLHAERQRLEGPPIRALAFCGRIVPTEHAVRDPASATCAICLGVHERQLRKLGRALKRTTLPNFES